MHRLLVRWPVSLEVGQSLVEAIPYAVELMALVEHDEINGVVK